MSEATVMIVLRLVSVITILVGAIFLGMTFVAYVGASRAIHAATEGVGSNLTSMTLDFTWYGLLAQAVIVGEGILLYFLSPMLAQRIVK